MRTVRYEDNLCYNGGNMEKMRSKEKHNEKLDLSGAARKLSKLALAGAAAAGVASCVSGPGGGIMNTERAKDADVLRVDGVSIHGGPNLRNDPEVPYNPEDSNIYVKFDSDQTIEVPYEGEFYVYDGPDDQNGAWCGFPAKEFTETLHDAGCISEGRKKMIDKREQEMDGYVWINSKYVDLNIVEAEDTNIS